MHGHAESLRYPRFGEALLCGGLSSEERRNPRFLKHFRLGRGVAKVGGYISQSRGCPETVLRICSEA
jgi:hypothetical protein